MTKPKSKRETELEELDRLMQVTRNITMTPEARRLQALDFTYSNLACSTNHQPVRAAFQAVARESGLTDEEFEAWARDKTWRSE